MPTLIAMTPGRRARRWRRMRGPLGLLTLWLALATWALGSSVGMSTDPGRAPSATISGRAVDRTGDPGGDMIEPEALRPTWSEEATAEDPASPSTGPGGAPELPEQDAVLYALGR